MNTEAMVRRGFADGDLLRVGSRRGELVVGVQASDEMRSSQVFMPMHWGGRFMNGGGVNALTVPAFDPVAKQPEFKNAAVQVEKLDYQWQLVAMRSGAVLRYLDAVRPLLVRFPYATCGLYGREHPVVIFRAAAQVPVAQSLIGE